MQADMRLVHLSRWQCTMAVGARRYSSRLKHVAMTLIKEESAGVSLGGNVTTMFALAMHPFSAATDRPQTANPECIHQAVCENRIVFVSCRSRGWPGSRLGPSRLD